MLRVGLLREGAMGRSMLALDVMVVKFLSRRFCLRALGINLVVCASGLFIRVHW